MNTEQASRRFLFLQSSRYVWIAAAILLAALLIGALAVISRLPVDSEGVERGIDASAARYQAMGEYYASLAAARSDSVQRGLDAAAARDQALGQSYSATQDAYTEVSRFYTELMRAQAQAAAEPSLEREIRSNSAGWVASGVSAAEGSATLEREIRSNSAGWVAYGLSAAEESATLPYTDVSLFYAERMRAEAHAAARAAQLPVCLAEDEIASNPEPESYRRWEGC
jgi:hypothetical protein